MRAGVEYLIGTQNADGGWTEEPFTGTGFPRVFYLKYHMYPVYFPLMAIGRYSASQARVDQPTDAGSSRHVPAAERSAHPALADS